MLGGASIQQSWDWLPQLGINLSFRLDALGLLFFFLLPVSVHSFIFMPIII
ncbi:hypothetical protein ABVN80_03525 [Acinetobacter baumannii]